MRVFLGLYEAAGYYAHLKRGFEELGHEATLVTLNGHPFKYGGDAPTNPLLAALAYCNAKNLAAPRNRPLRKVFWKALETITLAGVFVWAVLRHDAFVFGYGSSFFGFRELPLLKLLNKRIIHVFHGSDARPHYIDGVLGPGMTPERCIELVRKQKDLVRTVERYADYTINLTASAHFHEKPFVSWLQIGVPMPLREAPAQDPAPESRAVRILHSPSNPVAKGSDLVRAAIARLKERGYDLDYVEVVKQPNHVVLAELSRCDFVVDQLYSDTPMAHFATEAAAFGKPAIVGGYCLDDAEPLDRPDYPPTLRCRPDQVEAAIERLIVDSTYRRELGRQARAFVRGTWNPVEVAGRFLKLVAGDVPPSWLADPHALRYCHGAAISEERAKAQVRGVLELGGKHALQLADKPELEEAFVSFARADEPVVQS